MRVMMENIIPTSREMIIGRSQNTNEENETEHDDDMEHDDEWYKATKARRKNSKGQPKWKGTQRINHQKYRRQSEFKWSGSIRITGKEEDETKMDS